MFNILLTCWNAQTFFYLSRQDISKYFVGTVYRSLCVFFYWPNRISTILYFTVTGTCLTFVCAMNSSLKSKWIMCLKEGNWKIFKACIFSIYIILPINTWVFCWCWSANFWIWHHSCRFSYYQWAITGFLTIMLSYRAIVLRILFL